VNAELLYIGMTQDRVPVGIRERVHADAARRRRLAGATAMLADGVLLLNTCERFEVYASARVREARSWIDFLARGFGFSRDALTPYVRFLHGEDASRHLFRVAAGLESRLLGEPHILRQVRAAYLESLAHRELDPQLCALGRAAVHTGRRVRRETSLAATGESLITLALQRLSGGASLRGHNVVVLGTGMLAQEAAARLIRSTGAKIVLVSRVFERAAALAARVGAQPAASARLGDLLATADGLLACSSAAHGFLVDRRCVGDRRLRPLRIVDLGIPRNIDPDVATLPGVQLVPLAAIHAFTSASPASVEAADAIVARELERLQDWQRARQVAARIEGLCQEIGQSPGERRILHEHITRLKAQVAA